MSVLTPSSFDLDDVRYRHLDPVRLAGTALHEGHVLFDLDAALKEIQRLQCHGLKTERECGRLRAEGERLNDEVELLRAENRALGEQTTSEETRADIVRWMRRTADQIDHDHRFGILLNPGRTFRSQQRRQSPSAGGSHGGQRADVQQASA